MTGVAADACAFLAFRDERVDGGLPVLGTDGRTLALVEKKGFTRRFTARTPDGQVLCQGRADRLHRRYRVTDSLDNPLLSLRSGVFSSRRTVRFADGRRMVLRGASMGNWTGTDPAGAVVLGIERARGRLHFQDVLVRPAGPGWTLPLVIAVVVGLHQDEQKTTFWDFSP